MGKIRTVGLPNLKGQSLFKHTTNLEWALQFVKLKIQEMVNTAFPILFISSSITQIFNGRKTDQCGVIIFGSEGIQHQTCNFHIY